MLLLNSLENAEYSIVKLLKHLKVPVSVDEVITELDKHPDYPSLLALSDVLTHFGVQNAAYRVDAEELLNLTVPFIATTKQETFVVVKKISSERVYLINDKKEKTSLTTANFNKLYNGVVLVPDNDSKTQKWLSFHIGTISPIFLLTILSGCISVVYLANSNLLTNLTGQFVTVMLSKLLGTIVSILLIVQSFDRYNPFIEKLCGSIQKGDCNSILSSKAAVAFKGISWSEIGVFYFIGSLITVLLFNNNLAILKIVAVLNFCALPYTVYSIYYQARIAKQWYDNVSKRYDLHPVVRGVVAGQMTIETKTKLGTVLINYYKMQETGFYEKSKSIADLHNPLNMIRILIKIGRYQEACNIYRGELARALLYNLEADHIILPLIRPFFSNEWQILRVDIDPEDGLYLTIDAGNALQFTGNSKPSFLAYSDAVKQAMAHSKLSYLNISLKLASRSLFKQDEFKAGKRILDISSHLGEALKDPEMIFTDRIREFWFFTEIGDWEKASDCWLKLDAMGREWPRSIYRSGDAEYCYAKFLFFQNRLELQTIEQVERLAHQGESRKNIRKIKKLKALWCFERGDLSLANVFFQESIKMSHMVGKTDFVSQLWSSIIALRMEEPINNPYELIDSIPGSGFTYRPLAELCLAVGDVKRAKELACEAYKFSYADGQGYCHHYELQKTTDLLTRLGLTNLADIETKVTSSNTFPWESAVTDFITAL